MMTKPRWQQVGWDINALDVVGLRANIERQLSVELRPGLVYSIKGSLLSKWSLLAFYEYLLGNDGKAREAARQAIDAAIEYFWGNWRSEAPGDGPDRSPDPDAKRRSLGWKDFFVESSLWAACLKDWESVTRIAEYPLDDIVQDIEQSKENRAWLLCLASVLRQSRPDWRACLEGEHARTVREGVKRREKLLLSVLEGLAEPDRGMCTAAMERYLVYFRKTESREELVTAKVAIDASILFHLARHIGCPLELGDEDRARIVTLEI